MPLTCSATGVQKKEKKKWFFLLFCRAFVGKTMRDLLFNYFLTFMPKNSSAVVQLHQDPLLQLRELRICVKEPNPPNNLRECAKVSFKKFF